VDVALRIARALDVSVEELFGETASEASLMSEPTAAALRGRVALAHIAGRWLSYRLDGAAVRTSADALVAADAADAAEQARGRKRASPAGLLRGAPPPARLRVELLRTPAEARDNVVLMGCALGLGLLADRLNSRAGPGRFLWLTRSSTDALGALAARQTHLAGVHLVDTKTGEANVADVRRLVGRQGLVLITLARWEAGLVTAPQNGKGIRSAADLGRRGLRLVVREPGSGARRLLEAELRRAGLPRELASAAPLQASGHLEVAQAVALGAADVGVATRDAALALGLGFVPLAEERFDLVLPLEALADVRLARLFDVLSSTAFQRELACLGYDVRSSGARVAELSAA
jgi:molybdate-binding protein